MSWSKTIFILMLLALVVGALPLVDRATAREQDAWPKVDSLVRSSLEREGQAEFLVVLRQQADLSGAEALPSRAARGAYVYRTLWELAQDTQQGLRAYLDAHRVPYRAYYLRNMIWVQQADLGHVLEIAARPEVARIEANPWVRGVPEPSLLPAAETDAVEWNVAYVRAPQVWALGYTGQGVVVAGNDTGIDWQHPALLDQYREQIPGYGRHDFNWHDAIHSGGGSCGPDSPQPCDDYGHGTHTLGTVVGDDGGSNQIGMAPGAAWIGCRNMNVGWGSPATYTECFEFFLAPYPVGGDPSQGNPSLAPHVINNSWTCPPEEGCSADTLEGAVDALRAAGIEVVASAGNGGSGCATVVHPPAIYPQTFTVGAIDDSGTIASFSSRGPVSYGGDTFVKPDVSAPGVDVRSSVPGGGYSWMSGTSMASPHVAGLVALILSANPDLSLDLDALEQVITSTAIPQLSGQCGNPGPPNNVYGWGIIDALSALYAALPGWLEGTVTDANSAAPIEGASIVIEGPAGVFYVVVTDPSGYYTHTLPAGSYTVTASAAGYAGQVVTGVVVLTDTVTAQDFALTAQPCEPVEGADFSWQPSAPLVGQVVTFTAAAWGGRGGWITETVDDQMWLGSGSLTSLDLDADGRPHIVYQDDDYALTYLYYDGFTWISETVDSVGPYASLALDSIGQPHISYYYLWTDDLRYAYRDGGGWHVETVDSMGTVGPYTSLALDAADRPHISYYDQTNARIEYAWYDGAQWHLQVVDDALSLGGYIALALDSAGRPHVSYWTSSPGELRYAYSDTQWLTVTVDQATTGITSLAVDAADHPHVAYQHLERFRYAYWDGASWITETVDATPYSGWYNALALDAADRPHTTYHRYFPGGANQLNYAWQDGTGWHTETVDSAGWVGYRNSLALDAQERPHVSYCEDLNDELRYAWQEMVLPTPPLSFTWDLGDGTEAAGEVVAHSYGEAGRYTVTLTATNPCGQAVAVHSVVVGAGDPDVTVDPLLLAATLNPGDSTVRLLNIGNVGVGDLIWTLGENPAVSWLDELPGGGVILPGGSASVQAIFDAAGLVDAVYTTTLEVASNDPDQPQVDVGVILTVTSECIPVAGADLVYAPPHPDPDQTVTFTATVAQGTLPISYNWGFGDGAGAEGKVVGHVYVSAGTYTVVLTATNCAGAGTASATRLITVGAPWRVSLPLVFKQH